MALLLTSSVKERQQSKHGGEGSAAEMIKYMARAYTVYRELSICSVIPVHPTSGGEMENNQL